MLMVGQLDAALMEYLEEHLEMGRETLEKKQAEQLLHHIVMLTLAAYETFTVAKKEREWEMSYEKGR